VSGAVNLALCPTKREHIPKLCNDAAGVSETAPFVVVVVAVVQVRPDLVGVVFANRSVTSLPLSNWKIAKVVAAVATVGAVRAKVAANVPHRFAVLVVDHVARHN